MGAALLALQPQPGLSHGQSHAHPQFSSFWEAPRQPAPGAARATGERLGAAGEILASGCLPLGPTDTFPVKVGHQLIPPHCLQVVKNQVLLTSGMGVQRADSPALLLQESESEVAQSCPTLCNPMDCSLPGFSIHGIFQARVLVTALPPLTWQRHPLINDDR